MSKHYQIIKNSLGFNENFDTETTDEKSNEVFKMLYPNSGNTLHRVLMNSKENRESPSPLITKKSAYSRYRQTQKEFFKQCCLRKNFDKNEVLLHQRNLKSTKTMKLRKSRKSEYINSISGTRMYWKSTRDKSSTDGRQIL